MRQVFAIARYAGLEALRSRSALSAGAALLLLFALSFFLREIAIADGHRLQTTFLAAGSRVACVFMGSLFIISAVVREFNDRGHLLLLAQDLSRARYTLGKYLGLGLPLMLMCLGAGTLVGLVSGLAPSIAWTLALALEVALMAAISLFCALSLRQILPAASLAFAFYLLARSMAAIQLIAHGGIERDSAGQQLVAHLVDSLALLLPRLDSFAASRTLVEAGHLDLGSAAVQTLLYAALALTAAGIDLSRREL